MNRECQFCHNSRNLFTLVVPVDIEDEPGATVNRLVCANCWDAMFQLVRLATKTADERLAAMNERLEALEHRVQELEGARNPDSLPKPSDWLKPDKGNPETCENCRTREFTIIMAGTSNCPCGSRLSHAHCVECGHLI